MKIGFGVSAFEKCSVNQNVDGIGKYTESLYSALIKNTSLEVLPCAFSMPPSNLWGVNTIDLGTFRPQVIQSLITRKNFSSNKSLSSRIDLFHSTDHYIPKFNSIPVVATIHDVIPFSHASWFGLQQRIKHQHLKKTMVWPDHVITVSNYSKRQIMKHLNLAEEEISVVHHGVDESWQKRIHSHEKRSVLDKYGLSKGYIIFVGTIQSRKNLGTLIRGYKHLPKTIQNEFDLVIVGGMSPSDKKAQTMIQRETKEGKIKWLGYLPTNDTQLLVKSATCLAFPSLAEGFGFPVLEGFAAGVPVLASNTTSIPEVAGNAAVLFPPEDHLAIAHELASILLSRSKREEYIDRGKRRVEEFTWAKSAEKTLVVYEFLMARYRSKR